MNVDFAPLLLFLCCSTACASTAAQEPWSRFRGPNGSGVADCAELPVEFGPGEGVVWRVPLAPGHSSPVLSADGVFLTTVEDRTLATVCVERASGEVRWRREARRGRAETLHEDNNPASPSPAVDGEVVVVFFPDLGLLAYDHAGEELWRRELGPFDNLYGMGASPVLHEDRVFLACDQNTGSFLLALDKRSGEVLWRAERPEAKSGHCTPILHRTEDGDTQLVLPGSFYLDAYDVETGERVWWFDGLCFEMKSVPVFHDGLVLVNGYGSPMNDPGNQIEVDPFEDVLRERDADGDGAISEEEMPPTRAAGWFQFVDLEADGVLDAADWTYLRAALRSQNGMLAFRPGGDGRTGDLSAEGPVWSYRRSIPQLPSPLVYEGVLYMLNDQSGLITTLDPGTGELIERGRIAEAVDDYLASPVAGGGHVYLASEEGLVTVLPAGGSLEPLAVHDLGERCFATPALADGRIYLRTEKALYCFGATDG